MGKVWPHIVAAPVDLDEFEPDAADWFGHHKSTPEVIARANAEWAAMDWRGRLPEGWAYDRALKGMGQ